MTTQLSAPHTSSNYGFGDAAVHLRQRSQEVHRRLAKAYVFGKLVQVSNRAEDWDGCGSAKPIEAASSRAFAEVTSFIDAAFTAEQGWQDPQVGSNEIGEISFEWWRGEKKFTTYIGPDEARYVCSWGADINHTMDAGVLPPDGFLQKWRWFRT